MQESNLTYYYRIEAIIMPRVARIKSSTGIYHLMERGINQQNIFSSDDDYERFLNTLTKYCRKSACEIYAYCLMDNHIHLLLKECQEPIATTMKRIGTSYVYYYNWQYNRKGHLFQHRYKSEDDKCLDITEKRDTFSDKMIIQLVSQKYNIELATLSNTKPEAQRKILQYLKELNSCSLRQLSRLTGLTVNQIARA